MNSLEQMMGLNSQGIPNDFAMQGIDPMYAMAMQNDIPGMMEQVGVPQEQDPYQIMGMEDPAMMDPGAELAREMLGGQYPAMTQEEINNLALSLGIDNGSADLGTDPMFSPQFDLTSYMTGGM